MRLFSVCCVDWTAFVVFICLFSCDPVFLQAKHIEEVCKASENVNKVDEEKMVQRMTTALKNREEFLNGIQKRLKEHVREAPRV